MSKELCVESITFGYREHRVLSDLSFRVVSGRTVGILGANGAGKSTLFKLILGILPLKTGGITIDGRDIRRMTSRERARHMAYIPQKQQDVFAFSVFQMVLMGTTASFGLFAQPGKEERERAEKAMALLHLESFADRPFSELSGGEQQLVLIARAVAQNAPILLMDEPCASLDYGNQIRVLEEIRTLAKTGYLILFSTHNPQHVLSYADDVLLIDGGQVRAFGTPENVLSSSLLSDIYSVPIRVEQFSGAAGLSVMPDFERLRAE